MKHLPQQEALQVESYARMYTKDGWFVEPFIKATFVNLDRSNRPTIDLNGKVPLPSLVPVTFDCKGLGQNTTAIFIELNSTTAGVVVYWTKYLGFEWNQLGQ